MKSKTTVTLNFMNKENTCHHCCATKAIRKNLLYLENKYL